MQIFRGLIPPIVACVIVTGAAPMAAVDDSDEEPLPTSAGMPYPPIPPVRTIPLETAHVTRGARVHPANGRVAVVRESWMYMRSIQARQLEPYAGAMVATLLASLVMLRLRAWAWMRVDAGEPFCGKCGYQLTGATSATCPECGADRATSQTFQRLRRSHAVLAILLGVVAPALGFYAAQASPWSLPREWGIRFSDGHWSVRAWDMVNVPMDHDGLETEQVAEEVDLNTGQRFELLKWNVSGDGLNLGTIAGFSHDDQRVFFTTNGNVRGMSVSVPLRAPAGERNDKWDQHRDEQTNDADDFLGLSADGRWGYHLDREGGIFKWSTSTGKAGEIGRIQPWDSSDPPWSLFDILPGERFLARHRSTEDVASISADGRVHWKIEWQRIRKLSPHGTLIALNASLDLSRGYEGFEVRSTDTFRVMSRPKRAEMDAFSVCAFSPDDRYLYVLMNYPFQTGLCVLEYDMAQSTWSRSLAIPKHFEMGELLVTDDGKRLVGLGVFRDPATHRGLPKWFLVVYDLAASPTLPAEEPTK